MEQEIKGILKNQETKLSFFTENTWFFSETQDSKSRVATLT